MANLDSVKGLLQRQPMRIIETIYGPGNTLIESQVVLAISAVVSENYSMQATVTTYPVEDGTNLSEHAAVTSSTISISAITSDASLSYFDTVSSFQGSAVGQLLGFQSRSQGVYDTLMGWMNRSVPLIVKSHFAKAGYKDRAGKVTPWIIESLSIPRDRNTGSAIKFDMTMRQVQFVTINKQAIGAGNLGDQVLSFGPKTTTAAANNSGTIERTEAPLLDNAPVQGRFGGPIITR